jgi:hypothetical protein
MEKPRSVAIARCIQEAAEAQDQDSLEYWNFVLDAIEELRTVTSTAGQNVR